MLKNKIFFLLLLQGGLVLVYEIVSSRLLAPFFGNSLPVWTFVLGITLLGLSMGYAMGSRLAGLPNVEKYLSFFICFSCGYIILILKLFPYADPVVYRFSFMLSLALCSVFILLIPMAGLGTVSPLAIEYLHRMEQKPSGTISGKVFFISTAGGILWLFPMTLWWMPAWGICNPLLILSGATALTAYLCFRIMKHLLLFVLMTGLSFVIAFFLNTGHDEYVLFQSNHVMGSMEVVRTGDNKIRLLLNGIIQSENDEKTCFLPYADTILNHIPEGNGHSKALVIGLGGGYLCHQLVNKGYNTDAVELHPEVIHVARIFFHLQPKVRVFCEDGRFFLNRQSDKPKYERIILDVFHGESPPYYLFTRECLLKIRQMLTPQGKLYINWHGYISGTAGVGSRYLISTLRSSGFSVQITSTGKPEDYRNQILMASPVSLTTTYPDSVSTDFFPKGEFSNALAQLRWRKNYFHYFAGNYYYKK